MSKRYQRNQNTLSAEENEKLKSFRVAVVGCGGLGGYVIEELGRLGIGSITAIDGDVFDETNLNRQILSNVQNLGCSKAMEAAKRMSAVNPEIEVNPIYAMLERENAIALLSGHDIVVDALDNPEARAILEQTCEKLGTPFVHGAIAGWFGQVAVIFPGDRLMEQLFPAGSGKGAEVELGNPSFTPAVIASIETAEVIKVLLGKETALKGKLLTIDLLNHEYEVFTL